MYFDFKDLSLLPPYRFPFLEPGNKAWLISYAKGTDNFFKNQNHLAYSAIGKGFDVVISYNFNHLERELLMKHPVMFFIPQRGAGYWLWKPWVIKKTLEMMQDNDILFYSDVGVSFIQGIEPFLEKLINHEMVYFDSGGRHGVYTKMDAIVNIGLSPDSVRDLVMPTAGFLGFKKTAALVSFIDEWLKLCEDEQILTDETSIAPNFPEFKDHRHDQSLLSLALVKNSELISFHNEKEIGPGKIADFHGKHRTGSMLIIDKEGKAFDSSKDKGEYEFCFKRALFTKETYLQVPESAVTNMLCEASNDEPRLEFSDYSMQPVYRHKPFAHGQKVWLISYSKDFELASKNQQYLVYSAINKGVDAMVSYNKFDLPPDRLADNCAIMPYIMQKTLSMMAANDILIYIDVGVSIKAVLEKVIYKLNDADYLYLEDNQQLEVLFFVKNSATENLVKAWSDDAQCQGFLDIMHKYANNAKAVDLSKAEPEQYFDQHHRNDERSLYLNGNTQPEKEYHFCINYPSGQAMAGNYSLLPLEVCPKVEL